jgi:hypothetical protein
MYASGLALIMALCVMPSWENHYAPKHAKTSTGLKSYDNISWCDFIHTSLSAGPRNMRLAFKKCNNAINLAMILLIAGDISLNLGPRSMKNTKLAFANTRSMKNKYTTINNFITSNEVDIFCVNETWLSDSDTNAMLADATKCTTHHELANEVVELP